MGLNITIDSMPDRKGMNEIEKQLHEQYAINANNNLTALVSIAAVLLSAIGTYGYVFINAGVKTNLFALNPQFSPVSIEVAAIVAIIILGVLFHISLYLGANQRMEQFVMFAIRCKYYGEEMKEIMSQSTGNDPNCSKRIYPKDYHPFNKTKGNFVQGLHNESLKFYKVIYLCIVLSSFLSFFSDSYPANCNLCPNTCCCFCGGIVAFLNLCYFLVVIFTPFICCGSLDSRFTKYTKRCEEYKDLREYLGIENKNS